MVLFWKTLDFRNSKSVKSDNFSFLFLFNVFGENDKTNSVVACPHSTFKFRKPEDFSKPSETS